MTVGPFTLDRSTAAAALGIDGCLEVEPSRLTSRVRDRETAALRRVLATLGVER